MNKAECNYKIYDREMLAITEALKDWHMYLEGLPQPFKIITNHCNPEILAHCTESHALSSSLSPPPS
jgi:hypothetical protein